MKISYYPIVIFAYNRPKHLKELLKSIKNNKNYKNHKFYFFCDGPKKNHTQYEKNKIKKNILIIKKFNINKKIIKIRKKNYGLAKNIIDGVSFVIKKNKACIVLEDDLILHEDCLNFINFGLNKFEKDKSIGSISGFSYIHKYEKDNYQNWFKLYRHCSWSWGTWRTVWNKVNWNIESLSRNKLEKGLKKKKFLKAGNDIPLLLFAQLNKIINSWAVRFNYNCLAKGLLSISPTQSLVKNNGFGINATHTINFFRKKKITFNKYNSFDLTSFKKPKLNKKFNDIIKNQHPINKKLYLRLTLTNFFKNL